MGFLISQAVPEVNIAADAVNVYDLAVNPLSVVLINIRPLNDTGTLANFQNYMGLADAMNWIRIFHNGKTVFAMKGKDLAAMLYYRHGIVMYQGQNDNTNNERRCLTLPILLGRAAFDPVSCFPASRRGELRLELDMDIADTGYDTLNISVDTIELPDAKPKEWERRVTVSATPAATGDYDMDMPLGNLCRGVLLFGTTPFAGASPAPSWGRLRTLIDNQEQGFGAADFEVLQQLHCLWGRQPPLAADHKHIITTDGNAQTELATLGGSYGYGDGSLTTGFNQYAFLDFDPTKDDTHTLDLRGKSRFNIRATVETADAIRACPIEVIKV